MISLAALVSGCLKPEKVETEPEPLFCDHTETSKFTQEEIDWRAANAPWNLKRDLAKNEKRKRWCLPDQSTT